MRKILLLVLFSWVSAVFIVEKHRQHAAPQSPVSSPNVPRKTSEHDWAKQALETTVNLQKEIAQREKDGGQP